MNKCKKKLRKKGTVLPTSGGAGAFPWIDTLSVQTIEIQKLEEVNIFIIC